MSYHFENPEIFDLKEEFLLAFRSDRGASATLASVNLPTIPVVYQHGVS